MTAPAGPAEAGGENALVVRVARGEREGTVRRFTGPFTVGRLDECGLSLPDGCVSRRHLEFVFDGKRWWARDLDSANGTLLDGRRIGTEPLPDRTVLELGAGGPLLDLTTERRLTEPRPETPPEQASPGPSSSGGKRFSSEKEIIGHYFDPSRPLDEVGDETRMFRLAFEKTHKKRSRKYIYIIGVVLVLLTAAGGTVLYQKSRLDRMRQTAVDMFYGMKALEVQIAQIEDLVLLRADDKQLRDLADKRMKLKEIERSYDGFLRELQFYRKLGPREQIIYRMAHQFGECEVNLPEGFLSEVKIYIEKWRSTDRLGNGIRTALGKGYVPKIGRAFKENNLPPKFFFLGLQESGFNDRAVGPPTRFGHAKGVWQFIPLTAQNYGLNVGTQFDQPGYDPEDERFDFDKATNAAVRYIRDLYNTEAQASGLLVMASYNWGERNTLKIIREMPQNPRERNFWRLLAHKDIPKETYDYVFYIFSAAVICEDPRRFGFDLVCPPLE